MTSTGGRHLIAAQSLRKAVVAGLIAITIFCTLWIMVTALFDRVLPWLILLLGCGLGFTVRRAGQGLDWRFPMTAALLALIGALIANVVVAAANTGVAEGVGTVHVLRAVTLMTWPVFFDEVLNAADTIYALFAASLAAFFAKRKLTRDEYFALRLWLEEQDNIHG